MMEIQLYPYKILGDVFILLLLIPNSVEQEGWGTISKTDYSLNDFKHTEQQELKY